jgi:DNA-binding CsgD family transcriptional regulator
MTRNNADDADADECEIGHPSAERVGAASEVAAAIAHQLSGPLTALLLYIGDLSQNGHRFPAADGTGQSLQQVADSALREAERICALLQRIGDALEAPVREETAITHGREVIRWWSRTANAAGAEVEPAGAICEPLTPRESEVLRLVVGGCSNKEGGVRMQISHRTFECHRAEVMRKFAAKNVAELIRLSFLIPKPPEVAGPARPPLWRDIR